jgi:hypothetical protein
MTPLNTRLGLLMPGIIGSQFGMLSAGGMNKNPDSRKGEDQDSDHEGVS